ncbi:MAG TPA: hypothetical protein VJ508_10420, partial [Saprospiraceae bacterium]|nr:hypothetical protein [Saprospiraceae bacterium]
MKSTLCTLILACGMIAGFPAFLRSQEAFEHWMHEGPKSDNPNGIRSAEWYANPTAAKSKTVIVAVMDCGVDIDHPDLKANIWINPHEIPGNHVDDDGNGYVDDVHGWNFLGGPDGRSVVKESLEVTRLYGAEKAKWDNVNPDKLKGKKKKEYDQFKKMKETVETKLQAAKDQLAQVEEMQSKVMKILG